MEPERIGDPRYGAMPLRGMREGSWAARHPPPSWVAAPRLRSGRAMPRIEGRVSTSAALPSEAPGSRGRAFSHDAQRLRQDRPARSRPAPQGRGAGGAVDRRGDDAARAAQGEAAHPGARRGRTRHLAGRRLPGWSGEATSSCPPCGGRSRRWAAACRRSPASPTGRRSSSPASPSRNRATEAGRRAISRPAGPARSSPARG